MAYFVVPSNFFTLTLNPTYPVTRTVIAPRLATPGGAGVTQVRRRYPRPLYQFTIGDAQMDKRAALALTSFLAFHQGDIPFYWSGGEWGTIDGPVLFGIGDGVRTQWYLPNRHITGSLTVADGHGLLLTTSAIDGATGMITIVGAVEPNLPIYAAYTCVYKLTVWNESEVLLSESNIYAGLFKQDGVVLREFVP